ncbi:HrpA-like helicase [Treponema sp. JC4]|uniref:helicase-related protein n=1 Tax=Treponema sp. JC4 TaxID=1124982 RepID=UPI00025B0DE1|nr:ATP-dependent RNA helicase [Treponema sp. JC4]EID85380.1 HrpA-like helicase [Treponema sp. JC4]
MAIDYKSLPVYAQKQKILDCLENHQVVIVESPTGSGKTTQIPVILYEAGYATNGMIGVTQPRRIAALSVSEFISKQLGTTYPGLVGYKMRFEDQTNQDTRIKIMTDGILLQEMKLDPWLSKYSVLMIDEAHERSLNIDFVLGLVKRVLKERKDFHVIVSSATMNTQVFSEYFDNAPIVSIDTITYPVSVVYDPIEGGATTATEAGCDAILNKICRTVDRVLDNGDDGGILIFLPGEKIIKDCMYRLEHAPFSRQLWVLPLYGRLQKEEQERVFDNPPNGKKKVVISTNIAETSVTIQDITTVIDCGLAKLNFYSPRTFTSSLVETLVSKASCNQRKGRAGRTHEGTCYRLYSRKDFESREMYTKEEIYRTDLSEVVLRMAELGITDFYNFDFIASPGREGIIGAVDTLNMLGALDSDNTLSEIGKLMVKFPLEPRISRIIVEAIMRYPDVTDKALVAASFLSANSPFVLPPNEEMEARKAHHRFRDLQGDFGTFINLFNAWKQTDNREKFCKKNYLDERVMSEIENIYIQLGEIVGDKMGIPLTHKNGSMQDYLCCIAAGMIQFVCIRTGRENYRSLTADHICIHPGSVMFRQNPVFIVAGEIVRTSRIFAMSVSPLTHPMLDMINPDLFDRLMACKSAKDTARAEKREKKLQEIAKASLKKSDKKNADNKAKNQAAAKEADENFYFGGDSFETKKIKGKKTALLPLERFITAAQNETDKNKIKACANLKGRIILRDGGMLLDGEKLSTILEIAKNIILTPIAEKHWNRNFNGSIYNEVEKEQIIFALEVVLRTTIAKQKNKEYGFITLYTDGKGNYWLKTSRGFSTALQETHASLEALVEEEVDFSPEAEERINAALRLVNKFYDKKD